MIERTHKFLRPFDAKQYLVGAPVGCRMPSLTPEILKIAEDGWMYGIIHRVGTRPAAIEWTPSGSANNDGAEGPHDLVMVPLFELEGRPVFVGDTLESKKNGARMQATVNTHNDLDGWTWPGSTFPRTTMSSPELVEILDNGFTSPIPRSDIARKVANAALQREVELGNIVAGRTAEQRVLMAAELAFQAALECARLGTKPGANYFVNLLQTVKESHK